MESHNEKSLWLSSVHANVNSCECGSFSQSVQNLCRSRKAHTCLSTTPRHGNRSWKSKRGGSVQFFCAFQTCSLLFCATVLLLFFFAKPCKNQLRHKKSPPEPIHSATTQQPLGIWENFKQVKFEKNLNFALMLINIL